MITVQQILVPVTEEETLQTLIDILASGGFASRSWQSGSKQLTTFASFARMYATASDLIPQTAAGGFNQLASEQWLWLLSESHYDNKVIQAVNTRGELRATAAPTFSGPQTYTAGTRIFADDKFGFTYRNRFDFTLNAGAETVIELEAEVAAANRDVAPGTITIMKTPIAGVSVSNPEIGTTGTWITRNGADIESDDTLRLRNSSKWGTLGVGPGLAYQHWARMGHESVRRVYVDDTNPRGPGTVDVYIAGDSGPLAPTVVTAVDEYLHGLTDGIDRVSAEADLLTKSAPARSVAVAATVYVIAQYNTDATKLAIQAAIANYFKTLKIGGTRNADNGPGVVVFGALFLAIMQVKGVQNVAFSAPTADLALIRYEVAVPTVTLAYLPV